MRKDGENYLQAVRQQAVRQVKIQDTSSMDNQKKEEWNALATYLRKDVQGLIRDDFSLREFLVIVVPVLGGDVAYIFL